MPRACNIPPHLLAFCGSAQPQSGSAVPTPVARGDKAGRPCLPPLCANMFLIKANRIAAILNEVLSYIRRYMLVDL